MDDLFDRFRTEWICGHLDSQRAAEALDDARSAWRRLGDGPESHDVAELQRAQESLAAAFQRLAEVRAILAEQFDAFVGHRSGLRIAE